MTVVPNMLGKQVISAGLDLSASHMEMHCEVKPKSRPAQHVTNLGENNEYDV